MQHISKLFLSLLIVFSPLCIAQQFAAEYDEAAGAYQKADYNTAEKIWTDLAAKGDANSQYAIAIMHLKKEVQSAQDTMAFSYLVDAAKQQHVAAMFNLGVAYWEGRGIARQTSKALDWWEVAAQRDDAGAQYNLGLAYHIGEGRTRSDQEAIHWIQQASDNGHPQAKSLLDNLQKEFIPEPTQIQAIAKSIPPATPNASEQAIEPASANTSSNPSPVADAKPVETIVVNNNESKATESVDTPAESPVLVATTNQTAPKLEAGKKQTSKQMTALRAAPNDSAVSVVTIKSGATVEILEHKNDWSKVLVSKSYPVWIYESFVRDEGEGVGTIKGKNVNIRPSPDTDDKTSPPLGQMNAGEKVVIVMKRSPWVKIMPAKPFPAWVASKDIK